MTWPIFEEDIFKTLKQKNLEGMKMGVELNWWPSFDGRGPHPFPFQVFLEDKEIWHKSTLNLKDKGWEEECELDHGLIVWKKKFDCKFMSQLLVECMIFNSVGDAKKAGWNKEIKVDDIWLNKRTKRIIIEK